MNHMKHLNLQIPYHIYNPSKSHQLLPTHQLATGFRFSIRSKDL